MENQQIYVIACRHGERADFEGQIGKYSYEDPELTQKGISQARSIGEQLNEFIKLNDINQVIIESSPFLRTLETSCSILEQISPEFHNNKIYVNNTLSEFYRLFLIDPTQKLCFSTGNDDALQFLKKSNIEIEVLSNPPQFPESNDEGIERAQKYMKGLTNKLQKLDCKRILYVIVSHGYNIQVFAETMDPDMIMYEIDYCWSFLFQREPKTGKFKHIEIIKPLL